jgi:hypothetical protein
VTASNNNLVAFLWIFVEGPLAPLLTLGISAIYFAKSPRDQSLIDRIAASAHGASICLIYLAAWLIALTRASAKRFGIPFALLLLVPVTLIAASFFLYKGPKSLHWLQLINIACLLWTGLVGGMAVTGDWL